MNQSEAVFKYLQETLIAWKTKLTKNSVDGEGFNETNVVDIEMGALPTANVFDFIFIAPPIVNQGGQTMGARGVQRSTQTFVIDTYCKRGGLGNSMKRATLKAMHENTEYISNIFAKQGFMITVTATDLNYSGNNTARQIINVTRTFIKH